MYLTPFSSILNGGLHAAPGESAGGLAELTGGPACVLRRRLARSAAQRALVSAPASRLARQSRSSSSALFRASRATTRASSACMSERSPDARASLASASACSVLRLFFV